MPESKDSDRLSYDIVTDVQCAVDKTKGFIGFSVEHPKCGEIGRLNAFQISGWVLYKKKQQPIRIEFYHNNKRLMETGIDCRRPDVAKEYPSHPHAILSGFSAWIGLLGMDQIATIDIMAVHPGSKLSFLGSVKIKRHKQISQDVSVTLQPAMLTGLGRSGTTWLMKALMSHGKIVAHDTPPYELRAARYWTHMLKVLSRPALSVDQYRPGDFWHDNDFIGPNPYFLGHTISDGDLNEWMASDYIDSLASFGINATQTLYKRIAQHQNKPNACYFLEKHYPDQTPQLLWELYPHAKEIFIVRDFRDMVASMLSFNARRKTADFGRDKVNNDTEFVKLLGKTNVRNIVHAWKTRATYAHLVHYEDMVSNPSDVLHNIFKYLELDIYSEQLNKIVMHVNSSRENNSHITSVNAESSIGRWKTDLSSPVKKTCNDVFGFALNEFGYCSD